MLVKRATVTRKNFVSKLRKIPTNKESFILVPVAESFTSDFRISNLDTPVKCRVLIMAVFLHILSMC